MANVAKTFLRIKFRVGKFEVCGNIPKAGVPVKIVAENFPRNSQTNEGLKTFLLVETIVTQQGLNTLPPKAPQIILRQA